MRRVKVTSGDYSEEKKRGRASGITKGITGQLKCMEKHKVKEKSRNQTSMTTPAP
jgi:hypothetical protein